MIAKYVERLLAGRAAVTSPETETSRRPTSRLDEVERAVADIAAGRAVVVVDDASRENEGDIIFAASKATPELLAFTIRYARGLICVPDAAARTWTGSRCPPMTTDNQEHMGTAFTISVDARHGITTGISAADRARTIRTLADSATEPYEIVRPGPRVPAALHRGRRAAPARPHRGGRRPGPAGRADPGRGGGRDRQRRRHHGPAAAAARLRRSSTGWR